MLMSYAKYLFECISSVGAVERGEKLNLSFATCLIEEENVFLSFSKSFN